MHTRYSWTNTQCKLIKSAFGVSEQALTTGSNLGSDLLKLCHSRAELRLSAERLHALRRGNISSLGSLIRVGKEFFFL